MRHDPADPTLSEEQFDEVYIDLINDLNGMKEKEIERAVDGTIVLARNPGIPFDVWAALARETFHHIFDQKRASVPDFAESWASNLSVPLFDMMGNTSTYDMRQALMAFSFYMGWFGGLYELRAKPGEVGPTGKRPNRRALQRKALSYIDQLGPHFPAIEERLREDADRALKDPTWAGNWERIDKSFTHFLRDKASTAQIALWMRVQQRWWELFALKPSDLFSFDGAPSFRALIESLSAPAVLP